MCSSSWCIMWKSASILFCDAKLPTWPWICFANFIDLSKVEEQYDPKCIYWQLLQNKLNLSQTSNIIQVLSKKQKSGINFKGFYDNGNEEKPWISYSWQNVKLWVNCKCQLAAHIFSRQPSGAALICRRHRSRHKIARKQEWKCHKIPRKQKWKL